MDTNILLESGTNELEILEFVVDGHNYGINVAKIREIISYTELTPIPNAHPFVEGAFSTRGETITGIINIDKHLVILLDFENIVAQISPESGIQLSDIERLGSRPKNNKPILYAEDSQFLSLMIYDGLTAAGFTNLMPLNNGLELWELLEQYRQEGTLKEKVACVVTDIEMPQMDGHRLLKLIKETPAYKDIPVIIFSSLINEEMRHKGEQLGADAQLSKHEMAEFVKELDRVLA